MGTEGETLDEIAALFALPLDEFTAARNALAQRLKKDGDAETAEQVHALAKPSVAAWAVNQLARSEPDAVRGLLNVGARLRAAQEAALKGEQKSDALRTAQAEERDAVRALTQRAEKILRDADRSASGPTLERIASTLRAAALSEPARTLLREGRLTGDVEVSGFDAFAGLEVPKGRRRSAAKGDDLSERRQQKRELERQRRALEKRVRELETRAEAAERESERARKEADSARALAEERRREADAAAAELAELN